MEAATIADVAAQNNIANWIVIKGVMDYADPNKEDRYKPFAAKASAEVLRQFMCQHFESLQNEATCHAI